MSFDCLEDDGRAEEAHERRIKRCISGKCNAKIIWLKTDDGKNVPADEGTVEIGEYKFIWGRHTCHFDTCKDPGAWKARRG